MKLNFNEHEIRWAKRVGVGVGVVLIAAALLFGLPKVMHYLLHELLMDVALLVETLVVFTTGGFASMVATWLTWKAFFATKQKDMIPLDDVFDKLERDVMGQPTFGAGTETNIMQFACAAAKVMSARTQGVVLMFLTYNALFVIVYVTLNAVNVLR